MTSHVILDRARRHRAPSPELLAFFRRAATDRARNPARAGLQLLGASCPAAFANPGRDPLALVRGAKRAGPALTALLVRRGCGPCLRKSRQPCGLFGHVFYLSRIRAEGTTTRRSNNPASKPVYSRLTRREQKERAPAQHGTADVIARKISVRSAWVSPVFP